ncbi:hypothetical protein LPJ53_002091 [Coemansia erecta]|uniref:RING-type domain-containing protein n=1 Tax=Coemansia erecta TaxID=147472 RepID=A0A9W8CTV2_9FUNG|nr:hypothetical protein LPJ53_002091 [Coemansia erecta]
MDLLAAAAEAADAESDEPDEMEQLRGVRARVRTGNELLSRIVSRSAVSAIARELGRRNQLLRREAGAGAQAGVPNGVPEFQLNVVGGLDLYVNIMAFILSILESGLDDVDGLQQQQQQQHPEGEMDAMDEDHAEDGDGDEHMVDDEFEHEQEHEVDHAMEPDGHEQEQEQRAGDANGGTTATTTLESANPDMEFRVFLLPGAIEQALDHYARQHTTESNQNNVPSDVAADTAVHIEGQQQQQPHSGGSSSSSTGAQYGQQPEESQAAAAAGNSADDDIDTATAAIASVTELLEESMSRSTASISLEQQEQEQQQQQGREQSSDENMRAEARRVREEKFRRLRDIARAASDERRSIAVPMVVLGVRANPELRRSARMALRGQADAYDQSSETNPGTEAAATAPTAAASAVAFSSSTDTPHVAANGHTLASGSGVHGAFRRLHNRMSGIVTGLFGSSSASHSDQEQEQQQQQQPGSDHVAAGAASDDPGSNSTGTSHQSAPLAADGMPPPQAADSGQPGLSVFITIRYMQLGNPSILPMVTYSLFPELFTGPPSTAESQANLTGSNYDLFVEISNIIGQAQSTTVSQDLIDKNMHKYRFMRNSNDQASAQREGSDDTVLLVSAERCPVCLEDFAPGNDLRVLSCHHALHLSCGDAWFTQGSNMCPICRQAAVQVKDKS